MWSNISSHLELSFWPHGKSKSNILSLALLVEESDNSAAKCLLLEFLFCF